MKFFTFFLIFLLSLSIVSALEIKDIQTFEDFNRKIPELNEQLQEDPLLLHPFVLRFANNEDVAVHVTTNQGYIQSFVISIYENYVTKIIAGPQPTKLYVEISEETINEIIQNPELALTYYKDGTIKIKSTNTVKKAKLFVYKTLAKWFA